jgi:hypothetical protein
MTVQISTRRNKLTFLRPFFKRFGSKWRLSKLLGSPLEWKNGDIEINCIVEPFAGSAAYSTRFGISKKVVLLDRDPMVTAIWRYLINVQVKDFLNLPLLGPNDDIRNFNLPWVEEMFIRTWIGPQGNISNTHFAPGVWKLIESGIARGSFWSVQTRARLAKQLSYIRDWTICHKVNKLEMDWFDLNEYVDNTPNILWIVDPPYQDHQHNKVYGKLESNIDYVKLANWCQTRTGPVIIHEQHGATWLPGIPQLLDGTHLSGSRHRPMAKSCKEIICFSGSAKSWNLHLVGS